METIIDRDRALKYFTEQLSEGTSLSRSLLEEIDLSAGIFRVGMPAGTNQAAINFDGWVAGLRNERKEFARLIERFIEVTAELH